MPLPVKVKDVADELEMLSDEFRSFLNRKTGEILNLPVNILGVAEELEEDVDDEEVDLLEWEKPLFEDARRLVESEDFLRLPDKYEVHEYKIMERFCDTVEDDRMAENLFRAIRGRGAFRRFKDTLYRFEIEKDWYDFRRRALEGIAVDWLEFHEIPYISGDERKAD